MGKGIVKAGGEDGLYRVEITLHKDRVSTAVTIIDNQIAALTIKIDDMEEGDAKELEKLRRSSYQKRKDYFSDNMPEDPTLLAWCADLTEALSGNVGIIEVPGERGIVQIQPGHEDNAVYDESRDGQLQPAIAGTPESVFYNLAMLSGWQKWMPTYRHGIISNIDTDADTCDVQLDYVISSQQSLTINKVNKLVGIEIKYMDCNATAFENGDPVLVEFPGQSWNNAKVIGFKNNPKACCFSNPFTEEGFTWNLYTRTSANSGRTPAVITAPTNPFVFSSAFDKAAGSPGTWIWDGSGSAAYNINNLDLTPCKYLVFKIDYINIHKDMVGPWASGAGNYSYGNIALSTIGLANTGVIIYDGALPGIYYKEVKTWFQANRVGRVHIGSGFGFFGWYSAVVHHEVNMVIDYVKMSDSIPDGGIQVWTKIPL